jgi:glucose-1-phosphate cytidylyltransferase
MKVVLFCGGLGMRLRDFAEDIPKPMVTIGYRPILWHVMKYYAHFGHKDFILCLGYKGDLIKNYFLNYNECVSNDFVLSKGGKDLELLGSDIQDWRITFVDTGLTSNIGERLKAVEKYLRDEDMFMVNYSDGLCDLPLDRYVEYFRKRDKIASFISVRPTQSFHVVTLKKNSVVRDIQHIARSGFWINGGFFIMKKEIFKYIRDGEDLINRPFQRLIKKEKIISYKYDGFWGCMDTFKDRQVLNDMYSRGETPWEVWKHPPKRMK